jgi:hypothetical protein
MDFPTVHIHSNPRHLGKMRKGHKVRLVGGDFPICLHPENCKKVMKAMSKGKGIHHALTPEEIKENHGRGFFDDIGNALKKGGEWVNNNIIKPVEPIAKEAGKVLLPVAKDLANKGIDYAQQYAPQIGGTALAGLATLSGNPELAPLAYQAGSNLGRMGGNKLADYAHGKVNSFDPYHTSTANSPSYNPIAPPSRQPQTSLINSYTGENNGALDKASMGNYLANMGISQLENLIAQKRKQMGIPNFDYSGGRSMSQYADAVPATGMGLYGGMPTGHGLYGGSITKHPRQFRPRREMGSIGIQGNLIGNAEPPALESQAYSANFQFGHTLPPAFQRFSQTGRGMF